MINPTIDKNGNKIWLNAQGQLHREDGPSKEWVDGDKFWCRNGQLHREDGPAIEWADGRRYWYIHGMYIE
jgi:hypothetical protein